VTAEPLPLSEPAGPEAPDAPTGVWSGKLRLLTIGLILTITLVGSEALAISAVMPDVEDELGDRWLYGWVFSAFFLGSLVGITLAGRMADRTHPWKPFAIGLVLFCGGLIAGGLAPSMIVLVVARAAQGLGAGALPATAYVCIGRAYPPSLRPRMFALLSTAWIVPGVLGPSLAVRVGASWGWRWVFLGLVPLVLVVGTLAVRAVRESVPASPPQPADRTVARDAVLVAVAAAVVLAGLTAPAWYLLGGALALGLLVGLPPYWRLTPPGVLRGRPGLPAAIACRGLLTAAFFSVDAFVALALVEGRGTGDRVVGFALSATTLLWVAGAWLQDRTIHRLGPRRLVRTGLVGLAACWAVAALAMDDSTPVAVLVLAFALSGLAMGPAYASISVTTLGLAEPGAEGRATSALQLTDVLGTALGTGAAGALVAFGDRSDIELPVTLAVVFAVGAAVALLGTFVARGVPARLPQATAAG
jgi:MFS family permease